MRLVTACQSPAGGGLWSSCSAGLRTGQSSTQLAPVPHRQSDQAHQQIQQSHGELSLCCVYSYQPQCADAWGCDTWMTARLRPRIAHSILRVNSCPLLTCALAGHSLNTGIELSTAAGGSFCATGAHSTCWDTIHRGSACCLSCSLGA